MADSEQRLFDNGTISSSLVKSNWFGTGSKFLSVIDIKSFTGGGSMTIKVFRIDPGGKGKLGSSTPILSHAGITTAVVDDQYVTEVSTALFTGLFRTEYNLSAATVTLTHTETCKD